MADRTVATTATLDTLRTTYNSTATDVGDISGVTGASGVIADSTDIVEAITAINTEVGAIKAGTAVFETKITFEGDTDDAYETVLAITDPTADRTITFPNATGTVVTTTATQTLTNKTLTAPTLTSAVLNTAVSGSPNIQNQHSKIQVGQERRGKRREFHHHLRGHRTGCSGCCWGHHHDVVFNYF